MNENTNTAFVPAWSEQHSTQAEGRGSRVFPAESFFGRRGLRGGG